MSKAPYLTPDLIRNGIDVFSQLLQEAERVPYPNFHAYRDKFGFSPFSDDDIYGRLILIRDRAIKVAQKLFGNRKTVLQLKNSFNYDPVTFGILYKSSPDSFLNVADNFEKNSLNDGVRSKSKGSPRIG